MEALCHLSEMMPGRAVFAAPASGEQAYDQAMQRSWRWIIAVGLASVFMMLEGGD